VRGYEEKDLVNTAIKLNSFNDAAGKIGYSENWSDFTLCESVNLHFNNPIENIGPIYVVNILDPGAHKTEQKTLALMFEFGRAEFASANIILDTLLVAEFIENINYILDYNYTKGTVIIQLIDHNSSINGNIFIKFYEADPSAIS
jgi:hypothetical protein